MATSRADAVRKVLSEIEKFEIDHQQYFDDAEPRGWYDSVLNGKAKSLLAFCRTLGWSELVTTIEGSLPIQGDANEILDTLQSFVVPEAYRLLESSDIDMKPDPNQAFWQLMHPRVRALAQPRFESGFYGDAVECCYKEVNDVVKRFVKDATGKEPDGAGLMTTAFSIDNPVIRLGDLTVETDRSIQKGYMQIFAGAMTGIRNPKAHGNLNPDASKTLHLICLASLLMTKFDERVA